MDIFTSIFSAMGSIIGVMQAITFTIGGVTISLFDIELAALVVSLIVLFLFPHAEEE